MKFFANVSKGYLVIHLLEGASPRCTSGKNRIPAEERDMFKDHEWTSLLDKPYQIWVCRACVARYVKLKEVEHAANASAVG